MIILAARFRPAAPPTFTNTAIRKLDEILSEARAAPAARRKALYDEAQRMLACDGPVAHLAYGTLFAAERSNVQGFRLNPTRSLLGLRDVTLAKGAAKE